MREIAARFSVFDNNKFPIRTRGLRGKRQHFLALRVEADATLFHVTLHGQQGGLCGAVAYVNIGVGQLARAAALQEILHVLRGDVAREALDDRLGALLRGMELVAVAVDEEAPALSEEPDAILGAVRNRQRNEADSEGAGVFVERADGIGRGPAVLEIVVNTAGGHGGERRVLAHKHVGDVYPVGTEIGELAAAEIEEGAEVEILGRIPVAVFHGTEEARPVQVGGLLRGFGGQAFGGAAIPNALDVRDLAEHARLDESFAGFQIDRAGALLHADLADTIVYARGAYDVRPFLAQTGQGLLDVDVFTGVQSVYGDGFVPMVGGGDEDGIEIFRFNQTAMVGEAPGAWRIGESLLHAIAEDIADGPQVDLVGLLKDGGDVAAALAGSDEPELHALVGAQDTAVRERC